ncbi:MAG: LysR family transcriptional regulator [Bdellovibrionaceae bacterium]|nr:LysR family transcriptional regulator [Pseudobdellovibrionaceae bacterium]
MSLSSLYLDAFMAVAKAESFSKAAENLHITQSALSQRIKNLESELGLTFFLRTPSGAKITEQGQRLLRFCQTRNSLESELIDDLSANKSRELTGIVRIGAYSSVLRSVVMPALAPLLQKHPHVLCEFICNQMDALPLMMNRAEVDLIILDHRIERAGVEIELLGRERFVVIEGRKQFSRDDIFLDNDTKDIATENFFRSQKKKPPKYRRSYFDDCYGIIDGVRMGLGKAVMSEHLVKKDASINISKGYKPFDLEVCLHYHAQPFYSKLHQTVVDELKKSSSKFL